MITMQMIETAFKRGVIHLAYNPVSGVVAELGGGTLWFFFDTQIAPMFKSVEDYTKAYPVEHVVEEIYHAVQHFHEDKDHCHKYQIIEVVLELAGITEKTPTGWKPHHEAIFAKAKALEHRACECLPGNSHNYEFYLGKARGIIEGAAIALGVTYDELNNSYNKWWKERNNG